MAEAVLIRGLLVVEFLVDKEQVKQACSKELLQNVSNSDLNAACRIAAEFDVEINSIQVSVIGITFKEYRLLESRLKGTSMVTNVYAREEIAIHNLLTRYLRMRLLLKI